MTDKPITTAAQMQEAAVNTVMNEAISDADEFDRECIADAIKAIPVAPDPRIAELEGQLDVIEQWGREDLDALPDCNMALAQARVRIAELEAALTRIERTYYQEATNPSPETVRRMAAKMNAIAYKAQTSHAALKGGDA